MNKFLSLLFSICVFCCNAQNTIEFLTPQVSQPNVYYVSANGSGTACMINYACSLSTALSLVQDNQTISLQGGDIFDTGGLIIPKNGVTINSYGTGSFLMRGSTSLSSSTWTSEANGFYSTPLSSAPKWIYYLDQAARQGQSAILNATRSYSSNTFTVSGADKTVLDGFNAVQSLVGCKIRFYETDYRLNQELTITAYNTSTGVGTMSGVATGNYGSFFLYGQAQFCTLQNDWYYDSSAQKLFVKKSTSPSGTNIRYGNYDIAFSATNKSNVTITNGSFMHYQLYAIDFVGCTSANITYNTINDNRGCGIRCTGDVTGCHIDSNTLNRIGLNGIEIGGYGLGTINSNNITDISTQPNVGWPTTIFTDGGVAIKCLALDPSNMSNRHVVYQTTFQGNNISNTAADGIAFSGENCAMRHNVIHDFGLRWVDCSGIHTYWNSIFDRTTSNNTVEYNIIYNGIGSGSLIHDICGIYIDNKSQFNTIQSNTIYNCANKGINFNFTTSDNKCLNNNIYGCPEAQIYYWNSEAYGIPADNVNNICTGNVLVCTSNSHRAIVVRSDQNIGYSPFSGTGDSNNNVFIGFTSANLFTYILTAPSYTSTDYTFSAWKTLLGKDAASTNIVTNRKPILAINSTASSTTITPTSGDYTDVSGSVITSLTLSPYSSQFYLSLDIDYKSLIAYATSQGYSLPTTSGQRLENERIIGWKGSGFWAAQDVIWCTKTTGDRNYAKINWKTPGTKNLIEAGTLTYVSNVGFKSDGSTGYLKTGFIPSTHGVNYTLNSGMVTMYSVDTNSSSINQFGASSGSILAASISNGSVSGFRINQSTSTAVTSTNSSGYFEWKRTSTNALSAYRNNILLGTGTDTSTSIPSVEVYILAFNAAGVANGFNLTTKDVGMFAIGAPTFSGYNVWSSTQ